MQDICLNAEEIRTIGDALVIARAAKLREFDEAQARPDVVSQQRAIRAGRDVRRIQQALETLHTEAGWL